MRADLETFRAHLDDLSDIVEGLEMELVDDPRWEEPSDTSYLNAEEKKNPDIASNVIAMSATNLLIDWFARDMEGFVGFWRGPDKLPIDKAPIVRLDTEGQYDVVAMTIADYLLISSSEDNFTDNREALAAVGLKGHASQKEIWETLNDAPDVNDYRHQIYNAERVKRGLEPIES